VYQDQTRISLILAEQYSSQQISNVWVTPDKRMLYALSVDGRTIYAFDILKTPPEYAIGPGLFQPLEPRPDNVPFSTGQIIQDLLVSPNGYYTFILFAGGPYSIFTHSYSIFCIIGYQQYFRNGITGSIQSSVCAPTSLLGCFFFLPADHRGIFLATTRNSN
jgi:hypothetical protein